MASKRVLKLVQRSFTCWRFSPLSLLPPEFHFVPLSRLNRCPSWPVEERSSSSGASRALHMASE
eukprot:CAMPEP_0113947554 /NCGR_PEP_ID=MMETSP1339-20121228/65419_1 /TAXON_ID=94617 /ORGANISM="Fibrocapsa japonica" /LENGTH=63 /DNA_ID=CAMNT_0000954203 /DNA_START=272 /DNA_END=463 /DNA_ORIENTATION=- /assembly_acc=CAM_ASM_000762